MIYQYFCTTFDTFAVHTFLLEQFEYRNLTCNEVFFTLNYWYFYLSKGCDYFLFYSTIFSVFFFTKCV